MWKKLILILIGMTVFAVQSQAKALTQQQQPVQPATPCHLHTHGSSDGYIFFCDDPNNKVLPAGKVGIEAAPSDLLTLQFWSTGYATTTGATATAVGTGQANTDTIVAAQGSAATYAASSCKLSRKSGFNDWFLPSKDEQHKMYVNLQSGTDENGVSYTPMGYFDINYAYWNSTEINLTSASSQYFASFGQQSISKTNSIKVRCVRFF